MPARTGANDGATAASCAHGVAGFRVAAWRDVLPPHAARVTMVMAVAAVAAIRSPAALLMSASCAARPTTGAPLPGERVQRPRRWFADLGQVDILDQDLRELLHHSALTGEAAQAQPGCVIESYRRKQAGPGVITIPSCTRRPRSNRWRIHRPHPRWRR